MMNRRRLLLAIAIAAVMLIRPSGRAGAEPLPPGPNRLTPPAISVPPHPGPLNAQPPPTAWLPTPMMPPGPSAAAAPAQRWPDPPPLPATQAATFHLPPPPGWSPDLFGFNPDIGPVVASYQAAAPGIVQPALRPHKSGWFQKLSFTSTWIDDATTAGLSLAELDAFAMLAAPLPTHDWPLVVMPGARARLLDGPPALDLPDEVYNLYWDFMWLPKLSERWTVIAAVMPGLYSDFGGGGGDGFRLQGKGLVRWDAVPRRVQTLAGVLYLDRDDVKLLPAGGVIWTPNDAVRYELIFPRPKLSHRLIQAGDREYWLYVGGEFGGDTWAVTRVNGAADRLTLRDLRLLLGWEQKRDGGAGWRVEAGYVFSRRIEFRSSTQVVKPPDAYLLRAGIDF